MRARGVFEIAYDGAVVVDPLGECVESSWDINGGVDAVGFDEAMKPTVGTRLEGACHDVGVVDP